MYRSREVIEKEITGYRVLTDLLDVFTTAVNNDFEGKSTGFDQLILELLPEEFKEIKGNLYERLLGVCSFIAGMSDRNAILLHRKIK
jgi:dGTPase